MEENGEAQASAKRIWVVTDGRAGNENPAKALAEGVAEAAPGGAAIGVKRLALRPGFALLPPALWFAPGAFDSAWPFTALQDRGAVRVHWE